MTKAIFDQEVLSLNTKIQRLLDDIQNELKPPSKVIVDLLQRVEEMKNTILYIQKEFKETNQDDIAKNMPSFMTFLKGVNLQCENAIDLAIKESAVAKEKSVLERFSTTSLREFQNKFETSIDSAIKHTERVRSKAIFDQEVLFLNTKIQRLLDDIQNELKPPSKVINDLLQRVEEMKKYIQKEFKEMNQDDIANHMPSSMTFLKGVNLQFESAIDLAIKESSVAKEKSVLERFSTTSLREFQNKFETSIDSAIKHKERIANVKEIKFDVTSDPTVHEEKKQAKALNSFTEKYSILLQDEKNDEKLLYELDHDLLAFNERVSKLQKSLEKHNGPDKILAKKLEKDCAERFLPAANDLKNLCAKYTAEKDKLNPTERREAKENLIKYSNQVYNLFDTQVENMQNKKVRGFLGKLRPIDNFLQETLRGISKEAVESDLRDVKSSKPRR
jgi:hypothetical protein